MRFTTLFTSIVLAFTLSSASPAPATPSASCSYSCPARDKASFAVGNTSDNNGILFCSYPAFQGENPNDFFCTYNSSTGALISDTDAGFCPNTAVTSCGRRRREHDVLPRFPKPTGGPVARDVKPEMMKVRSSLKKRLSSRDSVEKA